MGYVMSKDDIKVNIPFSTLKKIIPYVVMAVVSVLCSAGVVTVKDRGSAGDPSYGQNLVNLQDKYSTLDSRVANTESVQRTMLIQLSDIKEQMKANNDISTRILFHLIPNAKR